MVSRPEIYDKCLLSSLAETRGNHDIEIIPILNEDNRYSASNALNIGIDVSKSDYLIFVHQDVRLLFDWFECLDQLIDQAPESWGIIGSAGIALQYGRKDIGQWGGALNTDTVAVGSVWESDSSLGKVPYWDGIKELTKSHCADECIFVLNKKTGLRFDALFQGFHFYGVDICLQARAAGYTVHCAHLPIIHYGKYSASFTGDKKYWVYLRYLYHKWRFRFPEMLGTHFHWAQHYRETPLEKIEVPELTSYIDVDLESDDLCSVHLKAMGINRIVLKHEKKMFGDL